MNKKIITSLLITTIIAGTSTTTFAKDMNNIDIDTSSINIANLKQEKSHRYYFSLSGNTLSIKDSITATTMSINITNRSNYVGYGYTNNKTAVKMLQIMLNEYNEFFGNTGFLTVDGLFGPATYNAIKGFQKKVGLSVDGIAGTNTWRSLYNKIKSI